MFIFLDCRFLVYEAFSRGGKPAKRSKREARELRTRRAEAVGVHFHDVDTLEETFNPALRKEAGSGRLPTSKKRFRRDADVSEQDLFGSD